MIEYLPHMIGAAVAAGLSVAGWLWNIVHGLELRMVKVETQSENDGKRDAEFKSELADIRDNMVRRADLESLREQISQRIDDIRP